MYYQLTSIILVLPFTAQEFEVNALLLLDYNLSIYTFFQSLSELRPKIIEQQEAYRKKRVKLVFSLIPNYRDTNVTSLINKILSNNDMYWLQEEEKEEARRQEERKNNKKPGFDGRWYTDIDNTTR